MAENDSTTSGVTSLAEYVKNRAGQPGTGDDPGIGYAHPDEAPPRAPAEPPTHMLQIELTGVDDAAALRYLEALRHALESGLQDRTARVYLAHIWQHVAAVGVYTARPAPGGTE